MEIAILAVFLALFGGALFLAFLIWFIFLRRRSSSPPDQNFLNGASQADYSDSRETDDNEASFINHEDNLRAENSSDEVTAYDSPNQTENSSSGASESNYSPPPSYSESSSGSGDGGSSSDSGSSSSSD